MASDADVESLRKEIGLLKSLLDEERRKNIIVDGTNANASALVQQTPVPPLKFPSQESIAAVPNSTRHMSFKEEKLEDLQRQMTNQNQMSASSKSRHKSQVSPLASAELYKDSPIALEGLDLVPIDSRRGKWLLTGRQVLSRKENGNELALKLRETWLWSGRALVVDKIVVVPLEKEPVDFGSIIRSRQEILPPMKQEEKKDEKLYHNTAHNEPVALTAETADTSTTVPSPAATAKTTPLSVPPAKAEEKAATAVVFQSEQNPALGAKEENPPKQVETVAKVEDTVDASGSAAAAGTGT
jgi:hypothetical protein